jgi:pimeloyl-ACP methyl ester carboxylesterase
MISRFQDYRVKVYGRRGDKVVFLFCPFGTRSWQLLSPLLPIGRLVLDGYQVVCYDFNTTRVTRSPQKSLAIVDEVLQDVKTRVKAYRAQGVQAFSSFGTSMGTLFASYTAAHVPEIQKVVLILPYGDIAEHVSSFAGMWLLPKSRVQKFVDAAGGEKALRKLVKGYSPIYNAKKLSKKRVLLYLALKDKVMEYKVSVKLKDSLEKFGTNVTTIENQNLSHYWAAAVDHYKGSVYMDFLKRP